MSVYRLPPPNPRQREFFLSRARYTAYGGARGGGKSWAVRRKAALLCLRYPGIRVLILRRSYPELRENHILPMMAELSGVADYRESQKVFDFPGGSRLRFGYCESEADLLRYQGQEYDVVFIDEATQLTERQFLMLGASVRGPNRFPKRLYLTCNPGGVGHSWVKRLFIDREFTPAEDPEDYLFIPAGVRDNTALMKSDPGYLKRLESLPEDLRRAWLLGDWDVLSGRYFPEFSRLTHVVPDALPGDGAVYFAMDYGLDMLAGYWVEVKPGGEALVYREIFKKDLVISDAAREILALCREPVDAFIAPPDLWNRRQDTGRSAAEIFSECGLPLQRAENDRVQGWYELREWLRLGEGGPRLRVCESCRNLIKSLSEIQRSVQDPNDAARTPHILTHAPDALRYFAAARPACPGEALAPREPVPMDSQIAGLLQYGR